MSKFEKGRAMGLVRRMDPLGRFVVPKEFRKSLDIKNGDYVEIFLHEEGLFIRKVELIKVEGVK